MKKISLVLCVTCVLTLLAQPVRAQEWSAEQLEILEMVTSQWEAEKAGDLSWLELLHASFRGWPASSPMPISKDAAQRFFAAEAGQDKILAYNIAPVAIIVTGGTAVIHYYYSLLTEYADGEHEMTTGRSTDVLTRTEDGWRWVSWVGEERRGSEQD